MRTPQARNLATTSSCDLRIIKPQDAIADTPIDDGLNFDVDKLNGILIKEYADYEGVRVVFIAYLGTTRVNMQIDIGFGDEVFPALNKPATPHYWTFLRLKYSAIAWKAPSQKNLKRWCI